MYYLQSLTNTPDVLRPKTSMLSDKTNGPTIRTWRAPEIRKGLGLRATKAVATVALTTVSTCSQDPIPQSFVPFPSSSDDEKEEDLSPRPSSLAHAENGLKRPLPTETRRKRCQVPPTQSCHGAAPRRRNVLLASPRPRPAAASPPIVVPSSKRSKKSRRAVADMQFAADVHRSILRSMRLHEDAAMAVDGSSDVLRDQDRALADRLSKSLSDQGCSPVLIEGTAHHAPPSVGLTKVEVCNLSPEAGTVVSGTNVAGRAAIATQLAPQAIKTSASLSSSPLQVSRSPSPPPSTTVPSPGSRVYELPQLVATLHMRRHERTAKTRLQPASARVHARSPSPLASSNVLSADTAGI